MACAGAFLEGAHAVQGSATGFQVQDNDECSIVALTYSRDAIRQVPRRLNRKRACEEARA